MSGDEWVHRRLEGVFRTAFDDPGLTLVRYATAASMPAWDSLSHIVLMVAIEQEFGIRFRGNALAEMENIGELEDFLEAELSRR